MGDYSYIEDDIPDEWKGQKLLRFKPRSPPTNYDDPASAKRLQDVLFNATNNIEYRIDSGWTNIETGLPRYNQDGSPCFLYGSTIQKSYEESLKVVSLSFQNLMPFLRDDLTAAERMHANYVVSGTVLHETCVS